MKNVTTIPAKLNSLSSAETADTSRKRRVAAYARVSTEQEQQQTSYAAQVSYYTNYIQSREDWEFVNVYADEGISGLNTKGREAFKAMVSDALAGKIDLIITKSVSRFARNTVDSLTTIRELKEHGVECYFEKENIWTFDSKGELLLTIMSSIAQEESRSISENVRWGQRKNMEDGKVSLAYSNFLGYDKGPDGGLVINEEQAVIVRRIFSMFLRGYTCTQIAAALTKDGIPTMTGKKNWRLGGISRILKNEKYKGDALLQKTYTPDFLTKKEKINRGEVPQYYVKGDHEAIIEPEVFDHVQRLLAAYGTANRKSGVSILSGKICCGDCGGGYGQKVWHSNDKYRKVIWRCNQKYDKEKGKCKTPHLTEEQVKHLFVTAVNQLIAQRLDILDSYDDIIGTVLSTDKLKEKLSAIEAEMAELEIQNEDLIEQNATVALDQKEYSKKREAIIERYNELTQEQQRIAREINDREVRRETIKRFRHEFEKLEPVDEFDELLWVSMLDKLTVCSKERIVFRFRDGSEISVGV